MVNENVTILLISNSKLLKNKFIECLNDTNNQSDFTLMNKTIESLKSVSERINVPCLICDYAVQSINESDQNLRYSPIQPIIIDFTY